MLNYRRRGQNHRITDWKNGGLRNKAKSSVMINGAEQKLWLRGIARWFLWLHVSITFVARWQLT